MIYTFGSDQIAVLQRNRKTFNKLLKADCDIECTLEQYINLFMSTAIAEDLKACMLAEHQLAKKTNYQEKIKQKIDAILQGCQNARLQ